MDHHINGIMPGLAAPASGTSDYLVPMGARGAAAVPVAPRREAASGGAGRFEGHTEQNSSDFLTTETKRKAASGSAVTGNRKAISTLVARCALLGVSLSPIEDDAGRPMFIASQGAWTCDLHSVDEVDAFLRRLGGPKA